MLFRSMAVLVVAAAAVVAIAVAVAVVLDEDEDRGGDEDEGGDEDRGSAVAVAAFVVVLGGGARGLDPYKYVFPCCTGVCSWCSWPWWRGTSVRGERGERAGGGASASAYENTGRSVAVDELELELEDGCVRSLFRS